MYDPQCAGLGVTMGLNAVQWLRRRGLHVYSLGLGYKPNPTPQLNPNRTTMAVMACRMTSGSSVHGSGTRWCPGITTSALSFSIRWSGESTCSSGGPPVRPPVRRPPRTRPQSSPALLRVWGKSLKP